MSLKSRLRAILPRRLLDRKTRFVLARQLRRRGDSDWFDLEFRSRAQGMSDREFQQAYETAAGRLEQGCLTTDDSERLRAMLPAGAATVLEAGAGNGFLAERWMTMGLAVTAVDIAHASLVQTRDKGIGSCAQANLEHLPFPDGAFDAVSCCHTLEHVRDFDAALAELKRVTRPGGVVVALVPQEDQRRYDLSYHLNYFPTSGVFAARFGVPERTVQSWTSESDMFAGPVLAAPIAAR